MWYRGPGVESPLPIFGCGMVAVGHRYYRCSNLRWTCCLERRRLAGSSRRVPNSGLTFTSDLRREDSPCCLFPAHHNNTFRLPPFRCIGTRHTAHGSRSSSSIGRLQDDCQSRHRRPDGSKISAARKQAFRSWPIHASRSTSRSNSPQNASEPSCIIGVWLYNVAGTSCALFVAGLCPARTRIVLSDVRTWPKCLLGWMQRRIWKKNRLPRSNGTY